MSTRHINSEIARLTESIGQHALNPNTDPAYIQYLRSQRDELYALLDEPDDAPGHPTEQIASQQAIDPND